MKQYIKNTVSNIKIHPPYHRVTQNIVKTPIYITTILSIINSSHKQALNFNYFIEEFDRYKSVSTFNISIGFDIGILVILMIQGIIIFDIDGFTNTGIPLQIYL